MAAGAKPGSTMSDTAKMDEIDDVLSSVRKLVSHSDKQAPKSASAPANPFLLTPSLRVEGAQSEEGAAPEPDPTDAPESAAADSKAAELEAAVTAQPDSWEPEEGETLDPATWAASAFLRENVAEPIEAETAAEEPEVAILANDAGDATTEIAAATNAPEAEATDEPNVAVTEATAMTDAAQPDPAVLLAGIDNEALRKLVVDVLREELAGEIGERMTRNVRKLVRREINRVLVSRDLD